MVKFGEVFDKENLLTNNTMKVYTKETLFFTNKYNIEGSTHGISNNGLYKFLWGIEQFKHLLKTIGLQHEHNNKF